MECTVLKDVVVTDMIMLKFSYLLLASDRVSHQL